MSIVSGVLRGGRRGAPREDAPEVLDMDALERALREAREREQAGAPSPERSASPDSSAPTAAPRAVPSTAPSQPRWAPTVSPVDRRATPSVQRSTLADRTPLQPSWAMDADDDDWGIDVDDADWEALEQEEGRTPRRTAARTDPRLPEPVQAFIDKGRPWQAAFVVQEVLGPPRALAPYRTWPRT